MAKPAARIAVVQVALVVGALVVLGRAAQVQLRDGHYWRAEAERTRTISRTLPARRGTIYDRNNKLLAVTSESYHVQVALDQLTDRAQAVRLIARALRLPLAKVQQRFREQKYPYFRGPFSATQVEPLRPVRGVYLISEYTRYYPGGDLARPIIGSLAPDSGAGGSGLELALDHLLAGEPGEAVMLRDRAGRVYESPDRRVRDPVPGHDVVLTIDKELQEIAERAVEDALERMQADGGDAVFLDPKTGEILALVSRIRAGSGFVARPSTLTDPFEPGSTAKLFAAAALLSHGRVRPEDSVYAEKGEWRRMLPNGKVDVIRDSHPHDGWLTLAEAIKVSSNIATAKFALRLTPEEYYDALRDFGFGSPTGVEYPSESRGRLARPDQWHPTSDQPRIAMGYVFEVTALQLAAAYGAIANDGLLLAPALVKSIRNPEGVEIYRHEPEPVRQAVTPEVAAKLREFLRGAAGEGGTGEQAQLVNYDVLGKTGTAKQVERGRYVPGRYTASFAGIFPADHPQLVVIIKISNPKGLYYGGQTAAPLTREMLEQALATRGVDLDKRRLARADDSSAPAREAEANAPRTTAKPVVVVPWPPRDAGRTAPRNVIAVPAVVGTGVRQGLLALHRAGLKVNLVGHGAVVKTEPAAGDSVPAGTLVTVWGDKAPL